MRALLLFLARQEGFKNFIMRFRFFRKTAWRFVAGETLDHAVGTVRELNRQKIRCSLDLLGENTRSREDAENATREVLTILDRIRAERIDCNVSVKLTQLGLALDQEFCFENLTRIVGHARALGNFVRVDMEDSPYTQSTLDLVLRARRERGSRRGRHPGLPVPQRGGHRDPDRAGLPRAPLQGGVPGAGDDRLQEERATRTPTSSS